MTEALQPEENTGTKTLPSITIATQPSATAGSSDRHLAIKLEQPNPEQDAETVLTDAANLGVINDAAGFQDSSSSVASSRATTESTQYPYFVVHYTRCKTLEHGSYWRRLSYEGGGRSGEVKEEKDGRCLVAFDDDGGGAAWVEKRYLQFDVFETSHEALEDDTTAIPAKPTAHTPKALYVLGRDERSLVAFDDGGGGSTKWIEKRKLKFGASYQDSNDEASISLQRGAPRQPTAPLSPVTQRRSKSSPRKRYMSLWVAAIRVQCAVRVRMAIKTTEALRHGRQFQREQAPEEADAMDQVHELPEVYVGNVEKLNLFDKSLEQLRLLQEEQEKEASLYSNDGLVAALQTAPMLQTMRGSKEVSLSPKTAAVPPPLSAAAPPPSLQLHQQTIGTESLTFAAASTATAVATANADLSSEEVKPVGNSQEPPPATASDGASIFDSTDEEDNGEAAEAAPSPATTNATSQEQPAIAAASTAAPLPATASDGASIFDSTDDEDNDERSEESSLLDWGRPTQAAEAAPSPATTNGPAAASSPAAAPRPDNRPSIFDSTDDEDNGAQSEESSVIAPPESQQAPAAASSGSGERPANAVRTAAAPSSIVASRPNDQNISSIFDSTDDEDDEDDGLDSDDSSLLGPPRRPPARSASAPESSNRPPPRQQTGFAPRPAPAAVVAVAAVAAAAPSSALPLAVPLVPQQATRERPLRGVALMVTDSTSDEDDALASSDEESVIPPVTAAPAPNRGAPARQTATLAPPGAAAARVGPFATSRPDHRAIMADSSSEDGEDDMSSDSSLGLAPRRPGPRPAAARAGPAASAANPSASNNRGAAAAGSNVRSNRATAAERALQSSDEEGDGLDDSTSGASSQNSELLSDLFARSRSRPPGQ